MKLLQLPILAAITVLSACSIPDASSVEGVQTIPHQDVDTLPASLLTNEEGFTGVIIYGDRGYTGLVGNSPYPNIRVNSAPIGKCERRRAMVVPLEPGTHLVEAYSENTVQHEVTLEPGDIAYFRCNFLRIGGIFFPPAVLEPADAALAHEIVNGG